MITLKDGHGASQVVLVVKNLPANAGDTVLIPGLGRSPEGEHGRNAWKNPWTGGLQSIGLQTAGHDWSDLAHMHTHKDEHTFRYYEGSRVCLLAIL